MRLSRKHIKYVVGIAVIILATAGITYAAFGDKGTVLGSKFSVGSSDIKLLVDVKAGIDPNNLSDELTGPDFSNITPNWIKPYEIKIYNNGTTGMQLTSNANYVTANDPDDLRSVIFVEPFLWNDTNLDGIYQEGEKGQSYGKKTIIKWKTEGYDLGTINAGDIKSFILDFSTEDLSSTKQGKTGIYDFEFNSISL